MFYTKKERRSVREKKTFHALRPLNFNIESPTLINFINPMLKIRGAIILSLFIAICLTETIPLSQIYTPEKLSTLGPEYNDPEFIKLIDNYFGCKTWTDGICAECSQGYVFNNNGICCQVDAHCQQFNSAVGICENCYEGYIVSTNGSCTAAPADSTRQGCANWKNQVCTQCSVRYVFNADKVCVAVSDNCRTWDDLGQCNTCYYGYSVVNGACNQDSTEQQHSNVQSNPLCADWKESVCKACAYRSFFSENGVCTQVSNNCDTWDKLTGQCLSCYAGYDLTKGSCVFSPSNTAAVTDAGCKVWKSGVCQECSTYWVFNNAGVCIPVSDECRTYDVASGQCLTCYHGYDLVEGSCTYSESNNAKPTDGGCKTWDWVNSKCTECSANWVADVNGLCVPVSDLCRTNDATGKCTSCYKGYDLTEGACTFSGSNNSPLTDAGCKNWDWNSNSCTKCSNFWYPSEGLCLPVSDICKTFDETNGQCLSCYAGYDLIEGSCVFSPSNNAAVTDAGCKVWKSGVCQECSTYWVFNNAGVCIPVSDECRTYDVASGQCLTCYHGYDLVEGSCTYSESNNAKPTDGGCKTWDWVNSKCTECSANWVADVNGLCVPVSDLCRTNDATGKCTSCYKGYDLTEGVCTFSASNTSPLADAGCKVWNWTTNACSECSQLWVSIEGVCAPVSALCHSFDAVSGKCITCYSGYDLLEGACVYSSSNNAAPSDSGCKTWSQGVCKQCSQNWSFNDQGVCVAVSDLCKTSEGLTCTSCFNGYVLNNGACIFSPLNSLSPVDAGCAKWDWNAQVCLVCSEFWYFNNNVCVPVSAFCKTYDNTNGNCLTCYKGYELASGSCALSNSNPPSDPGCADWNWDAQTCLTCAKFWVLRQGKCESVSPYCNTYSDATGECTSCFKGYRLNSGTCEVAPAEGSLCKSTNEAGSCLTCYNGFALYGGRCVKIDSLSDIALYYAACCPEKLAQLQAEGRLPK